MEIIHIIGYACAVFIGLTLGLMGSGGSILTVPILVYLFNLDPVTATAYSLFTVGITALGGAIKNIQAKFVHFKIGVLFGIPSIIGVYLTRKYVMPGIDDNIFTFGNVTITKDFTIMIFFSIVMLLSAYYMIRKRGLGFEKTVFLQYKTSSLIIQGLVVGVITGFIGAGGGFLIIPALVLWTGLPMKKAVGTSLFIIALKSLMGFIGDIENLFIDWWFLMIFSVFSFIGIFIGIFLSKFIEGHRLKKAFGWFILSMSLFIFFKEMFF